MKRKNHIKSFLFLLTFGFVFTLLNPKGLEAQTQTTSTENSISQNEFMFVEIKGLDPYTYGDLVKSVRQRTDMSVKSACVPANIIMFEISNDNHNSLDENFESIKGLILQVTSLSEVNLMVGYSEEVFLKKCQEYRKP